MTSGEQAGYVATVDGVLQITIATSANGTSMDFAGINAGTAALGTSTVWPPTRTNSSATLSDQLDSERDGIAEAAGCAAGREGVDAFVAKREPDYAALARPGVIPGS
ncbi:hypothetical protein ACRS6B_18840 [Nocardia asteroides]